MKKNILIIDDDYDLREYLRIIFETYNYNVLEAENIKKGESKLLTDDIDLVILDVMMEKDSDGFNFAQKIKNIDKYKKIPIVMVTAVNQKTSFNFDIKTDGAFLPVDEFIEKPVELNKIVSIVEKYLN